MASIIVNQGLQRIGIQASEATGYNAAREIQVMAVDNATGAGNSFLAAHTKLNDRAAATVIDDQPFDAAPTISAQTVSHVCTYATSEGNLGGVPIGRISLHDNVIGSVDLTTATLVGGVDTQSLQKTSDFTLAITLKITYTSV